MIKGYFMESVQQEILATLRAVKGGGKFLSAHTTEFVFPGLKVDDVGEVAFPVNAVQVKILVKVAHPAPFGKGSKTIVDTSVRKVWEIDADKLTFKGKQWAALLDKMIATIKTDLGLDGYQVSAHLYKLLINEKGGFVLPHKDSEKEKGMFGTLVVGLPSKHKGGELVVSFGGAQDLVSFAGSGKEILL